MAEIPDKFHGCFHRLIAHRIGAANVAARFVLQEMRKQARRLARKIRGVHGGIPMHTREQMLELRAEQIAIFDARQILPQVECLIAQPAQWFIAIEVNPHQRPAAFVRGAVTMPFPRLDQERVAGRDSLTMFPRFKFAIPSHNQCKAEFRQRPAFLPLKIKIRRVVLRIWFTGPHAFPAGMREVKRLMKQGFIDGQRVTKRFREAHLLG